MSYLITWIFFTVLVILGELTSTQNFKVVVVTAGITAAVLLVHRIAVAAVETCR